MPQKKSKKPIYIILVVVALGALAYFYFYGSPSNSAGSDLTSDTNPDGSDVIGAQILTLLNETSSIHIDTAFFSDPVYQSLVDHTVAVPEQNVGRFNPFIAVPGTFVSAAPAAPATPSK